MNAIPLKQWYHEEGKRKGCSVVTIRRRLAAGKYPALVLRRLNSRVVFVVVGRASPRAGSPDLGTGLAKAITKSLQNEKEKKRMKKKAKKSRPSEARPSRLRLGKGALMVHHKRGAVESQVELFRAGDAASAVRREGPP